jgi:hypothetical protein
MYATALSLYGTTSPLRQQLMRLTVLGPTPALRSGCNPRRYLARERYASCPPAEDTEDAELTLRAGGDYAKRGGDSAQFLR